MDDLRRLFNRVFPEADKPLLEPTNALWAGLKKYPIASWTLKSGYLEETDARDSERHPFDRMRCPRKGRTIAHISEIVAVLSPEKTIGLVYQGGGEGCPSCYCAVNGRITPSKESEVAECLAYLAVQPQIWNQLVAMTEARKRQRYVSSYEIGESKRKGELRDI